MSSIFRRLLYLFRQRQMDADLSEEMALHQEMKQAEFEHAGVPANEATFASRKALGSLIRAREDARAVWVWRWLDEFSRDVAYATRTLRRNPGFSAVAILTLALGIGANTAIFSVVNAVILKPLPTPEAESLVRFENVSGGTASQLAFAQEFKVWRQESSAFEDIAAHRLEFVNVTGGTEAEQVPVARVTANFFRVFPATILYGRPFTADEDRPNGSPVAILSYGFWTRRFANDRRIVGQTLSLGGTAHVIVGVLGPDFESEQFEPRPDVWVPFQYDLDRRDGGDYSIVTGRLAHGISLVTANARLAVAFANYRRMSPNPSNAQSAWRVEPLRDAMVGGVRSSLNLLFTAVGLVLLIACANVSNLLLVRADVRTREMAIRRAIGAGRDRILRQLLTESIVLSLTGGVLGLVLGTIVVRVLLASYPGTNPLIVGDTGMTIPRIGNGGSAVTIDWRVFAFTVLASVLTGILFGLLPGWHAARTDPYMMLKQTGGSAGSGSGRGRTRSIFVVSEIAVALMLVVGAGLLIRTSMALRAVDPGFDADHVLTMRMSVTGTRFEMANGISDLTHEGIQRIRAVPGVTTASMACCMPLETVWQLPFVVAGRPASGLTRVGNLAFHGFGGWTFVSPAYFDVFKIPILRGRDFSDHDTVGAPGVVIINQEMARRFWPSSDPLKDRLILGRGMGPQYEDDPVRQIIGIVGDVRDTSLSRRPRPAMYVPVAQVPDGILSRQVRVLPVVWIIHTVGMPYSLSAPIEKELQQASDGLPISRTRSMSDVVSESTARTRFDTRLMTIFGCAALLLAAVGVYGLMAYSVQQRTHELGIRLALGANASHVRRMLIGEGMRLALTGIAIGIVAAFGLARVLAGFLFGVTIHDPIVFLSVPLFLSTVAFLAAWLPGQRATRIDPSVALRSE